MIKCTGLCLLFGRILLNNSSRRLHGSLYLELRTTGSPRCSKQQFSVNTHAVITQSGRFRGCKHVRAQSTPLGRRPSHRRLLKNGPPVPPNRTGSRLGGSRLIQYISGFGSTRSGEDGMYRRMVGPSHTEPGRYGGSGSLGHLVVGCY